MDVIKEQFDRVAVIVASIIAILVSGMVIKKALAFSDVVKTGESTAGNEVESADSAKVDQWMAKLSEPQKWVRPVIDGKPIPGYKSVPVVLKDGQEINMLEAGSEPVHPPIANEWWIKNRLFNFADPDEPSADADGDGFDNLSEFTSETDPNDEEDKPDWSVKLYLVERVENPYSFKFSADINPNFQVTRLKPSRKNYFPKAGEQFEGDPKKGVPNRFTLLKYYAAGADALQQPARVEVFDNLRDDGNPVVLELGSEVERPLYSAKLLYEIDGQEMEVKKGDEFELDRVPGVTIEVLKIEADFVTVRYDTPDGKSKEKRVTKKGA